MVYAMYAADDDVTSPKRGYISNLTYVLVPFQMSSFLTEAAHILSSFISSSRKLLDDLKLAYRLHY